MSERHEDEGESLREDVRGGATGAGLGEHGVLLVLGRLACAAVEGRGLVGGHGHIAVHLVTTGDTHL